MKFANTEVFNFKNAIRGMRNPLESWHKSDSESCEEIDCNECTKHAFILGENDLNLAQKLILAGNEHRKFMRHIFVSVDITAPLYWWKEFDTYKVGTSANSASTMHKLATTPITLECFEMDDYSQLSIEDDNKTIYINTIQNQFIEDLEKIRLKYLETKEKKYWRALIQLLPSSWLQLRTVTMNYENVYSMIHQRKDHKLTEWSVDFINWAKTLPYAEELLFIGSDKK